MRRFIYVHESTRQGDKVGVKTHCLRDGVQRFLTQAVLRLRVRFRSMLLSKRARKIQPRAGIRLVSSLREKGSGLILGVLRCAIQQLKDGPE
jgi:hypothetical protein